MVHSAKAGIDGGARTLKFMEPRVGCAHHTRCLNRYTKSPLPIWLFKITVGRQQYWETWENTSRNLPSVATLPRCSQQLKLGLGHSRAKRQTHSRSSSWIGKDPVTLNTTCYLPGCKLEPGLQWKADVPSSSLTTVPCAFPYVWQSEVYSEWGIRPDVIYPSVLCLWPGHNWAITALCPDLHSQEFIGKVQCRELNPDTPV